jgi:hypothetical protein
MMPTPFKAKTKNKAKFGSSVMVPIELPDGTIIDVVWVDSDTSLATTLVDGLPTTASIANVDYDPICKTCGTQNPSTAISCADCHSQLQAPDA